MKRVNSKLGKVRCKKLPSSDMLSAICHLPFSNTLLGIRILRTKYTKKWKLEAQLNEQIGILRMGSNEVVMIQKDCLFTSGESTFLG